jgi:cyclic lactone autoinducer peptide
MKKASKNIVLSVISKIALRESIKSANTTCAVFSYQPKMTNEIKKLRKF